MNLEDKLREILTQSVDAQWSQPQLKNAIAQIKQAFADAGWLNTNQTNAMMTLAAQFSNRMTGQEWYERFEKEMHFHIAAKDLDRGYEVLDRMAILKAARRAAGIED